MKFRENPFAFILDKMNDIENNGDSYTTDDKLYALCKLQNEYLTYKSFLQGKHELIRMGYLAVEGNPEDLWEDNQDWYDDEDEAWDEWEND